MEREVKIYMLLLVSHLNLMTFLHCITFNSIQNNKYNIYFFLLLTFCSLSCFLFDLVEMQCNAIASQLISAFKTCGLRRGSTKFKNDIKSSKYPWHKYSRVMLASLTPPYLNTTTICITICR